MIVDCNAHLGHWPFRDIANSAPEQFIALMDSRGITQAAVATFQSVVYADVHPANCWLMEAIAPFAERFLPQATINPAFPAWERDLETAIAAGFRGLRLYPNYHGYELSDDCMHDLLDAAGENRLPVTIHQRMFDERRHHPRCIVPAVELSAIGELATQYHDVSLLLCNCRPYQSEPIMEALSACANLHVDISVLEGVGRLETLIPQIGVHSIVFGSHAPYQYLDAALLKLRESCLSQADMDAIVYGNAQRLFGSQTSEPV